MPYRHGLRLGFDPIHSSQYSTNLTDIIINERETIIHVSVLGYENEYEDDCRSIFGSIGIIFSCWRDVKNHNPQDPLHFYRVATQHLHRFHRSAHFEHH